MGPQSRLIWTVVGCVAGLGLSFLGFGLLWIGTPWAWSFLLAVPVALTTALVRWLGGVSLSVLAGMLPVAMVVVRFRSPDDSHLMPVLWVASWALAFGLGHLLGRRRAGPGGGLPR